jgi:Lon protease-like protein
VIPVFPLDGALLLPHGQLPLRIFEPRYLNMIDDAMGAERMIGMIQTKAGGDRERPILAGVGCLGRITSFAETSDDQYLITLTGVCRFAAGVELPAHAPYRQLNVDYVPYEIDLRPPADDEGFDRLRLLRSLKAFLERRALGVDWDAAKNAPTEALINSLAMALPFEPPEKQALLEAPDAMTRRAALLALMEIDAAEDGDEPPSMQ